MKLYPLSLGLQEAPRDPFDPTGPQLYRVVVYEGIPGELPCPDCQLVVLTDQHPSPAAALGQLRRSVLDSMTRYEGRLIEQDLHTVERDLGRLDLRTRDLAHAQVRHAKRARHGSNDGTAEGHTWETLGTDPGSVRLDRSAPTNSEGPR